MKCRAMTRIIQVFLCVLVVVSAFFYAPMNVDASESVAILEDDTLYPEIVPRSMDKTGVTAFNRYITYLRGERDKVDFDFSTYMNGSGLYKFTFDITGNYYCSHSQTWWRDIYITMYNNGVDYTKNTYGPSSSGNSYSFTTSMSIYVHSDNPIGVVFYGASPVWTVDPGSMNFSFSYNLSNIKVSKVSDEGSTDYQNGYNAGYSAGEQAGYGNGYSNGFSDGEASVDTGVIYDEAFQAGKDSVDTQSYYDAGYQAGYNVAYSAGYESGYDVGYQSAMDRIENWGADTTDYPLRISSGNDNGYFSVHVGSDIPFNYRDSVTWYNSNDYNPNHTYKYVINFSNLDVGLNSDILYDYWHLYLNIGGIEYILAPYDTSVSVFIPGDRMSTSYSFDWVLYNCANFVSGDSNLAYFYVDYDFVIYDMGPTGDTQNHIANQTDQLTNGYDSSQGAAMNEDFKASVNDYQTAEDSLFTSAQTSLDNFTFLDFTSITGMVTALSFVSSIMTRIYNAMGGDTGAAGIILSVLFSIMLVSMAIGLYRFYVSNGKSDNSNKGGD